MPRRHKNPVTSNQESTFTHIAAPLSKEERPIGASAKPTRRLGYPPRARDCAINQSPIRFTHRESAWPDNATPSAEYLLLAKGLIRRCREYRSPRYGCHAMP